MVIGADLNSHFGEGNRHVKEVLGRFDIQDRNVEGQSVVDIAKRMEMDVLNTYFQKIEEHKET